MPKSATEVVEAILFSAVVEAVEALRAASKGVPNTMLRDLQSIHRNTAFADLPKEVQDSIALSVRSAFTALLKEGYAVGPRQQQASRPLDRVPERPRHAPGHPDRRGPPRGPRRGPGGGGPGKGPRPPKKPRPTT